MTTDKNGANHAYNGKYTFKQHSDADFGGLQPQAVSTEGGGLAYQPYVDSEPARSPYNAPPRMTPKSYA